MAQRGTARDVQPMVSIARPRDTVIGPARSWRRLSSTRRAAAREALIELIFAWALVRGRSFPSYVSRLGVSSPGDPRWDWSGDPLLLADVRWSVWRWNRVFRGRFTCLMQAMAGQAMLKRRGVESAVVLGVKPNAPGLSPNAHAWLRVGERILIGDEERPGHIPVASYRSTPTAAGPLDRAQD